MEKSIVDGKVGQVGHYDIEFKDGKLIARLDAKHDIGLTAGIVVELEAKAVFAAIKKAIPGQVDDAILSVVEAAILKH